MTIGAITHVGKVRSLNEDSYLARNENGVALFVVADGMGGHNAGEVASKIATEEVEKYVYLNDLSDAKTALRKAFENANKAVFDKSGLESGYVGMGTTLTALLVYEGRAYIANVGDSRTYYFLDNKLTQVTKDHSYVQRLVDAGYLTKSEAKHHPRSNVITKAIGTDDYVEVDIFEMECKEDCVFMLCSDGLTNHIDDDEITKIISEEMDVEKVANKLCDYALEDGGTDNITVVVVKQSGE